MTRTRTLLRGCGLAVALATLSSCWSSSYARDWNYKPPKRPGVSSQEKTEPVVTQDAIPQQTPAGGKSVDTADYHLTLLPGPLAIHVRKNPPRSRLVADRATIRIDIPAGFDHGLPGLAELLAHALLEVPDGANNQPELTKVIQRLGGDLQMSIGPRWTHFTVTVPSIHWQTALRRLANRLDRLALTQRQFAALQDRLIRRYLREWSSDPLAASTKQWVHHGTKTREEVIQAIEDRSLPEISIFQQRHYRPRGVAVGLWIPNSPEDPSFVVQRTRTALANWRPGSTPDETIAARERPPVTGVRWIEGEGTSKVALLLPVSPATPAWHALLECMTLHGIGGRLGIELQKEMTEEPVFEAATVGSYDERFYTLTTEVPARHVPTIWAAAQRAWQSLDTNPPAARAGSTRARLHLLHRQDDPNGWFEAAGLRLLRRQSGGPSLDLGTVSALTTERLAIAARMVNLRKLAMVVVGGNMPDGLQGFAKIEDPTPDYTPGTSGVNVEAESNAHRFLTLAVAAVGDKRQIATCLGYTAEEKWRDEAGLVVFVKNTYEIRGALQRTFRVLNSSIHTTIKTDPKKGPIGTETDGFETRKLGAGETVNTLREAANHPIILLASFITNKTRFRQLGMRNLKGRRVALLERIDDTLPRLRVTIDARTGLIRTVETTTHRVGVGAVQVRHYYDDYSRSDGIRVPLHRVTTVDGAPAADATYTSFRVRR